jgi:pyruvate dehydrogenase E1 component beta subunit
MKTTVAGALSKTLKEEMEADDRIFILGEDVGHYGGIYNVTLGLIDEFGPERVIDSPLSECARLI